MLLPFIIILTSLLGAAGIWTATGGLSPDGGNAIASVLTAIAIALAWGRGMEALERAYLAGRFDRVRRWLPLWGTALGPGETLLLRLWMAVEGRQLAMAEQLIMTAGRLDLEPFARSWASGQAARLENNADRALQCYLAGVQQTHGVDRAELYGEAALLLLQTGVARPQAEPTSDLRHAIEYANQMDVLLNNAGLTLGAGGMARFRYVLALKSTVRVLIQVAQERLQDADARIERVIARVRYQKSLRARRLVGLLQVERLLVRYRLDGWDAFARGHAMLLKATVLAGIKIRLIELDRAVRADQARRHRQQHAAANDAAAAEHLIAPPGAPAPRQPEPAPLPVLGTLVPIQPTPAAPRPRRDPAPPDQLPLHLDEPDAPTTPA